MSTALINFDQEEIKLVKNQIAPGASDGQLALFIQVCKQTGLNPFARQIYAVFRNEKVGDNKYESKMTIQTSIDGYRLLAQRSGEYAGQDGPYWYNPHTREWTDIWLEDFPPAAAKIGVMRKGFAQPIYAVASFKTYAVKFFKRDTKTWEMSPMWVRMPEVMIAKVAESLALRRAFPAELSGIYTDAEMEQADTSAQTVAMATQARPQTEEDKKKARLNTIFKTGKDKGLYGSKDEMAEYISAAIERDIRGDDIPTLVEEELAWVEQAIEAAQGLAVAS